MRVTALAVAAAMIAAPLTIGLGTPPADAAPLAKPAVALQLADFTQVQMRHGSHGYWPGRGWGARRWGGGVVVIGGVLVGSAIVAAAIAERRAEVSALRACARDYRSFDYEPGTYIARGGDVRVCPYLF